MRTIYKKLMIGGGVVLLGYGVYFVFSKSGSGKKGVVWDIGSGNTSKHLPLHLANLKELGIKHVIVKVHEIDHSSSARFNFNEFSLDALRSFQKILSKNGIGMSVVIWPVPNPEWIASMRVGLVPVVDELDLETIEIEAEGNWNPDALKGYGSLDEAALAVTSSFDGIGSKIGMVTHSGRINSTALSYKGKIDFVVPMAYSTVNKNKLPGVTQTSMHEKSQAYGIPIHMGLPAWNQEGFAGMTPKEAMLVAAKTSLAFSDVSELRWWSWKWIGGTNGVPRNQYAFDTIREMKI